MSNIQRMDNLKQLVQQCQPTFNELAQIHKAVNFKKEASFAMQVLKDNPYLAQMAMSNQDSLQRAVINVAAIGLSLNPVEKLAYLVPRDKKVCLDISYRGYVQLAVQIGSIKWAKAEIVRQSDLFEYRGLGVEPLHKFEPFKERGEIVGCYCVAKTHDGEYITEMMPISDVYSIRDRSSAWRAYKKDSTKINPWVTDESEMIKKTVIKRAYKSWPMTDTRQRIEQAIEASNESEGFVNEPIDVDSETVSHREEALDNIRALLVELDRTEEKYLEHLVRTLKRNVKALEDLTDIEIDQATAMLNQFVEMKRKKEQSA